MSQAGACLELPAEGKLCKVDADLKCTDFEFMLEAPVKASREFIWDLKRSKASSGGMSGEQLEAV
eukprot:2569395-Amphidinium_carterae.1